jgi:large subunit ribosomal protein L9
MKQQLLLLEDVESLGKKGEIVSAKPGYVRNYLLPKGYAVVASPNTIRKQERLRKERQQQALVDRREAEALAREIEGLTIETRVKVDPEGHMYGSVSAADIAQLFQEQGIPLDRKNVLVTRPIKKTGSHPLSIRLKEEVLASCTLLILAEGAISAPISTEKEAEPEEGEEVNEETPE